MKSSLAIPKFWNVKPPPLLAIYHTLVDGRKTVKSALLSPSVSIASRRLIWPEAEIAKNNAIAATKTVLPLAAKNFLIIISFFFDPEKIQARDAVLTRKHKYTTSFYPKARKSTKKDLLL